jgi:hypothetical protein
MLLCRTWPYPAGQAKPGTQKFRAFASPLIPRASAKLAFPLQPHMATIVLPDLTRSCSADSLGSIYKFTERV